MTEPRGAMTRRFLAPLTAAAMAAMIAACSPVSGPMSPEREIQPAPQETPVVEPADDPPVSVSPEPARAEDTPDDDATAAPDAATGADGDLVLGTIELSIESGGVEHVYAYDADHCFVSADYILAGGTGEEVGTGIASEVGISTSPSELLHEKTGTFQAEGIISVRTNGNEIVSDGRMVTKEGITIPSSFTYRHDDNSAHYVLAWFSGATQVGAGYVKVTCDH